MKRPPGQWAMQYESCTRCGSTRTKHMGKGLCRVCYFADYTVEHQSEIRGYKRKWYEENMPPEFQKAIREQKHFNGLREPALRRDGYRCTNCGARQQLVVHHRDHNGRGKPNPTNTLENLTTLCRACHLQEHRAEIKGQMDWSAVMRRAWVTRRKNQSRKIKTQ